MKKKFKTKQTKSASGSGSGLAVSLPTVSIFCSTRSTRGCFLCSRGKENKHRAPWPPSLYSLPHPTCCGRHFVSTCLHRPLFCISPPDRLPTNQPKANHNATHQIVDFVNRLWLPFVYQPTTPPPPSLLLPSVEPSAHVFGFLLFLFCDSFVLPIASCLFFFVELYKATDPTFVCVSLSIVVVVDDDVFCCKFVRAAAPCASSRFGQVSRSDRCDEYLSSFVFFFCCGVLVLRFCQGDNTGERTQDGIDGRRLSLRRHSLPPPPRPHPLFLEKMPHSFCSVANLWRRNKSLGISSTRILVFQCVCARARVCLVFF